MFATKLLALAALLAIHVDQSASQGLNIKRECKADVVFCLDNSASIGLSNWNKQIAFTQALVKYLDVGPGKSQVGVVEFGAKATRDFNLNTYTTEADVNAAIGSLTWKQGLTHTKEGLEESRKMLIDPQSGARDSSVPKVIVLITDGMPNVPTVERALVIVPQEADKIKALGFRLITIAIGSDPKGLNTTLLKSIATSENDYFQARNFDELALIQDKIVNQETCKKVTPEPPPTPPPTTTVPPTSPPPPPTTTEPPTEQPTTPIPTESHDTTLIGDPSPPEQPTTLDTDLPPDTTETSPIIIPTEPPSSPPPTTTEPSPPPPPPPHSCDVCHEDELDEQC